MINSFDLLQCLLIVQLKGTVLAHAHFHQRVFLLPRLHISEVHLVYILDGVRARHLSARLLPLETEHFLLCSPPAPDLPFLETCEVDQRILFVKLIVIFLGQLLSLSIIFVLSSVFVSFLFFGFGRGISNEPMMLFEKVVSLNTFCCRPLFLFSHD